MILPALFSLVLAAAPAPAAKPRPTSANPSPAAVPSKSEAQENIVNNVREIVLDEKHPPLHGYKVFTSKGYPTEVQFPEDFGTTPPTCGNCGAKDGLFHIDVYKGTRSFTIQPTTEPGRQEDGSQLDVDDFFTPVNVHLSSGLTLVVEVHYRVDRRKADARVIFSLPNRSADSAYVQQQLARQKSDIEQGFAKKAEEESWQLLLGLFTAEPYVCVRSDARAKHDFVEVEANTLCRFGSTIVIRYQIRNHGNAPFIPAPAEVRPANAKDSDASVEDLRQHLGQPEVAHKAVVTAAVEFRVGDNPPKAFDLHVLEDGGRNREIVLSGLSF